MKMSAYKISDNFNGVAGSKVMSPHHSHLTNGVRPSDSMTWYFGITQFWGNYHPGGEYELRTKDPAKYGGNGNQCVYDKCGKLITDQPGAGTVDWSSPEGEGHSHIRDDVKPFEDARYLESVCGLSGCINKYYEVRPSW